MTDLEILQNQIAEQSGQLALTPPDNGFRISDIQLADGPNLRAYCLVKFPNGDSLLCKIVQQPRQRAYLQFPYPNGLDDAIKDRIRAAGLRAYLLKLTNS